MPKFRELTGQFAGYVPDGPDTNIVPDRVPMDGQVLFTPVFTGGVIAFPELVPPEFAHPEPIRAKIIDGFVRVEVAVGDDVSLQPLSLMVTVDDEATQVWSWRAEFTNMRIGNGEVEVQIPAWSFRVPDGTGPVDLTELVPLKSGGSVDVTKGPRGAGLQNITAVDGQLVFEYTDGQESTVPIPEAVQGPEGPQGPAGADGEQGPEGPQGPAGEIPDLLVGNITDATPTGKNLMLAATEGAARNALGLAAGATAANGSAEELNTGTSNTARVWTARTLADHTRRQINTVNARDHGVSESNPDNKNAFEAAVSAAKAQNKELHVPSGTYPISSQWVIASDSRIYFDDVTIDCTGNYECVATELVASNISMRGKLKLIIHKDLDKGRGLRITGDNIYLESLEVVGTEVETGGIQPANLGLAIAGTNCTVGSFTSTNMNYPFRIMDSTDVTVDELKLNKFYRGVYIRDSKNVKVVKGKLVGGITGVTELDGGGLGFLLESVATDYGTSNVRLTNLHIEDTIDSSIRLGGQKRISKIFIDNVYSKMSGGHGIKILGGAQGSGSIHENIILNNIIVEDAASFSDAVGGVVLQYVDTVSVSNLIVRKRDRDYSCSSGIQLNAVSNVSINNPIIRDSKHFGIYLGGVLGNSKNINILGGQITMAEGTALVITNRNTSWENVSVSNYPTLNVSGTAKCFKAATTTGTPSDGSVVNTFLTFKTTASSANIVEDPTSTLNRFYVVSVIGPFQDVNFKNLSKWEDYSEGTSRIRKSGSWVAQ